MNPRVATVLSARDWEAGLVALAHETAAVRMVLRAYQPEEIEREAENIDVVVAGAEISWVTPARVASWRRLGLRVVGIHPAGDRPAGRRLEAAGVDEVFADDTPSAALLQAIRLLRPGSPLVETGRRGKTVVVTGPRGAPGRTEIALALAWNWARRWRTIVIDLDLEAPALAIRLGAPPRPDVSDAADRVHATGALPTEMLRPAGPVAVLVGSHRPGEPDPADALLADVIEAAAAGADLVVVDGGPRHPDHQFVKRADHAVIVAEGTPTGIVRASRFSAEWAGPQPWLVVNRVPAPERAEVLAAARRWTGLDPVALIPSRRSVQLASRRAAPPARWLRNELARPRLAT